MLPSSQKAFSSQAAGSDGTHHIALTVHVLNVHTGLPARALAVHLSQLEPEDPKQPWKELMKR